MYLKTREYDGASFVDKKSTVIFYQKLFAELFQKGKRCFLSFSKKKLCGFLSTNDAPSYSRFVDFLSTIHRQGSRVVCPVSCFNISQNDISALEHAYAPKTRLQALILTLNKMTIKFFQFSKFSNNLGISSEFSHFAWTARSFNKKKVLEF